MRLAKAGLLDSGTMYPDPGWLRAVEDTSDWLCTALFLAVPATLLARGVRLPDLAATDREVTR